MRDLKQGTISPLNYHTQQYDKKTGTMLPDDMKEVSIIDESNHLRDIEHSIDHSDRNEPETMIQNDVTQANDQTINDESKIPMISQLNQTQKLPGHDLDDHDSNMKVVVAPAESQHEMNLTRDWKSSTQEVILKTKEIDQLDLDQAELALAEDIDGEHLRSLVSEPDKSYKQSLVTVPDDKV